MAFRKCRTSGRSRSRAAAGTLSAQLGRNSSQQVLVSSSLKSRVRSAPPQICLWAVLFDAHAFQNLARTHVEKLHVRIWITLLVARDEVFQKILSVWRVDQETAAVAGAWPAGKYQRDCNQI